MSLSRSSVAFVAAVAVALLLAACGGGGNDRSKARVRLVNASLDYATLDLRIDDATRQSGVAYGETASYVEVDPDDAGTRITQAGSPTALLSFTPSLAKNRRTTLLAYGSLGALRHLQIDDETAAPDAGRAMLRVVNAAPGAGNVDVYLTAASDPLESAVALRAGAAVGDAGSPAVVDSGTWRIRVTAGGDRRDLRLDQSGIVLDSREVATLVLAPGRSGVLLNALLVRQGGAVQRLDTTLARVRLVAGVASSATVSARVGDEVLASDLGSPAVGLYRLLPAGNRPVVLAVAGAPLAAADVVLAPGADHTLLVRGTPTAPAANWIADDNRRPADASATKVRLVHGVASTPTPLSMTVDFVPAADAVAPGAASAYATVAAGATARVLVNAAGATAPLLTLIDQRLEANAVYTVFAVGDPAAPTGIVRKDR